MKLTIVSSVDFGMRNLWTRIFEDSEAPRAKAGPFDKAIRQVHGGESNRTAHGPEQVEGLPGKVYYIVPLPACRQAGKAGIAGHVPVK